MPIESQFGVFHLSRCPDREAFAESVVDYVDRKVQVLSDALYLPVPGERLQIQFAAIGGAQFIPPNTIELAHDLRPNDLGVLIHETVHWAQLPGLALYTGLSYIFEGLADYFRIVLSDDRQGDFFNDERRTLVRSFRVDDPYDSASEFVAYLRRSSGDPEFIPLLNAALRSGLATTVNAFFQDRCGQTHCDLLAAYSQVRASVVGEHPEAVNRYEFFTAMPSQRQNQRMRARRSSRPGR